MAKEDVTEAQCYLTIDGRIIVNIVPLIQKYPMRILVECLELLMDEKKRRLIQLLEHDITSSRIDKIVGQWFRINMAKEALIRDGGDSDGGP
jgi:hypothetical protein